MDNRDPVLAEWARKRACSHARGGAPPTVRSKCGPFWKAVIESVDTMRESDREGDDRPSYLRDLIAHARCELLRRRAVRARLRLDRLQERWGADV